MTPQRRKWKWKWKNAGEVPVVELVTSVATGVSIYRGPLRNVYRVLQDDLFEAQKMGAVCHQWPFLLGWMLSSQWQFMHGSRLPVAWFEMALMASEEIADRKVEDIKDIWSEMWILAQTVNQAEDNVIWRRNHIILGAPSLDSLQSVIAGIYTFLNFIFSLFTATPAAYQSSLAR